MVQSSTLNSNLAIGLSCGVLAAMGWAAGFVAAKHGIEIGFTPADLAFHRFVWTGIFMLPAAAMLGVRRFGGIGWGRSIAIWTFSGPIQSFIAYTGFTIVPLGHGSVIQPACATLVGLFLATLFLKEPLHIRRAAGAALIVAGLLVFGFEALTTIGAHGVGGDLLFVISGTTWAIFGTLLRQWQIPGARAALVVGGFSVLVAPVFLMVSGFDNMLRLGWFENLLQIVVQGLFAGALPIYLFGIAVTRLGAGRAATFPSLVPVFALILGLVILGIVPTVAQAAGLAIVVLGFQFVVRP